MHLPHFNILCNRIFILGRVLFQSFLHIIYSMIDGVKHSSRLLYCSILFCLYEGNKTGGSTLLSSGNSSKYLNSENFNEWAEGKASIVLFLLPYTKGIRTTMSVS